MPIPMYKGGHFIKLFYLFMFISAQKAFTQCPSLTLAQQNQDFCAASTPRVLHLIATNNGDDIVWYTEAIGGTALSANILLQNGSTYYAGSSSALCVPRPSVTVGITGYPPTNVDVAVSRCSSDTNTIAQLSADGTNIEWFTAQTGGVLLAANAPLANGATYWAQQTVGTCTSIRLPTTVTIIDPGEPTGPPEQFFCYDSANPTTFFVADLSASGNNINWYDSLTSTSPLDPSSPLINNATYYATQTTFPCESSGRYATIVRIENSPNPGTNGTLGICDSATATVDLFDHLGGTPDTNGTWAGEFPLSNGNLGSLDTSLLTPGSYGFTYTIAALNSCPEASATVTVTVQEVLEAGEDSSIEICANAAPIDLFALLGGSALPGGTWSPSLDSGTGVFDPAIDVSGTYTYTVTAMAPCTTDDTATVTVTVAQAPDAGNDASRSFCTSEPAFDLFALLGAAADPGGTWTPSLNSGTGLFDPSSDLAATYTYTIPPSASCPGDTAMVLITLNQQPNAGNDASLELCQNDPPFDLFSALGATAQPGGSWTPALASGSGLFNPNIDASGTYTYSVGGEGACPAATATVTVSVNVEPMAGENASFVVCGSDPVFDLFVLLGPNADAGGVWSGPSALANNDLGTFDPVVNTSGAYNYTVLGTGTCDDVSATITVNIIDPTPSLPPNGHIFCIYDNTTIAQLISRIIPENNNGVINVFDTLTGTAALNTADVLLHGNTYYISETDGILGCEGTNRLAVTIQINDPLIPTLSSNTAEFCLIDAPTIGELNAFIAQGNNVIWFDAAVNGNQMAETDALATGEYFAFEEDADGCRSPASNALSVMINDSAAPTLNPNGNELCGVERPTIAVLQSNLTIATGLTAIWHDSPLNGTVLNGTDLLIDNATYYVATFNAITGCESSERLEITVDLTACDLDVYQLLIPDGFSPNGDNINDTFNFKEVGFLYEDYTVEIYNRYGNLIFKGNNSVPSWDGTSNQPSAIGDKVLPNGVYFYIFNFNRDNVPPKQGRIYLNR